MVLCLCDTVTAGLFGAVKGPVGHADEFMCIVRRTGSDRSYANTEHRVQIGLVGVLGRSGPIGGRNKALNLAGKELA